MPITFVRYCPTTGKTSAYGYTTDRKLEGTPQAKILKKDESSVCELCPLETREEHKSLKVKVYTPILPDFSKMSDERWTLFDRAAIEAATPAFQRKEG